MDTREKILLQIRTEMYARNLDAYLVSSSDPHQSEYLAAFWKERQWISGFSGSSGILLITNEHAILFTDSRYFVQAEQELKHSSVTLFKAKANLLTACTDWILKHVDSNMSLGLNGVLFSAKEWTFLKEKMETKNIRLLGNVDLINPLWENRPKMPQNPVFELPLKYTGESRVQKIARIRKQMEDNRVDFYCCTTLDDIAWTLNLRGADIEFNPVFFSYLLIGKNESFLFADRDKFDPGLRLQLETEHIGLIPYESFFEFIIEIAGRNRIWIHLGSINAFIFNSIRNGEIYTSNNLIESFKSQKNETEIEWIKNAMIKDGVALVKLFKWLENSLKNRIVYEYEVADELSRLRQAQGNYFGESFPAIVGYQGNGAIVHYRPNRENSAGIRQEGVLLLDSGGQFIEGTTDITRTIALGQPTAQQIKHYTLVLKGNIALSDSIFPKGTKGSQLDVLARMSLWKNGLDYGHGTGHGVGYFLNVHEGPQTISPNANRALSEILPGMVTSNEPGLYLEGEYGIRLENLILCKHANETKFGQFLAFEILSLFPFDNNLIDPNLLNQEEKQWLNSYHGKVFHKLSPQLNTEEKLWLAEKCKEI